MRRVDRHFKIADLPSPKRLPTPVRKLKPSIMLEMDPLNRNKFIAGVAYTKEDMEEEGKKVISKYGHDSDKQFAVIKDLPEFDKVLENFDNETNQPMFVIYDLDKLKWVVFCLIRNNKEKITVLYKDSFCESMDSSLEKKIKKTIPDVEIIVQEHKSIKEDENNTDETSDEASKIPANTHNYGSICLINLNIFLLNYREDPKNLIKNFQKIKFYDSSDLRQEKFKQVFGYVDELAQNAAYKKKLKEFMDNLPLEMNKHMQEYKDAFAEEMNKDEDEIDFEKIKKLRDRHMSEDKLNSLKENCKARADKEEGDYLADIQIEFPKETALFNNILAGFEKMKVDDSFLVIVKSVSEKLGIDWEKMKVFYEFKKEKQTKKKNGRLKIIDIDEIIRTLPQVKPSPPSDGTPLSQLLLEIVLGMDEDNTKSPEASRKEITELENNFKLIRTIYEKVKKFDLKTIKKWVNKVKGKLKNTKDDVCMTIAIMDRAFNITTNFHYRDPQILAVLLFLLKPQDEGKLCQIKTGEGKTYIVSLVAVCKVLQGRTVDVITSSPILAQEGVDETKAFYSIFNITVGCNNIGKSKTCYEADVLYGTISSFQFDYLRDSFTGNRVRMNRKFGDVILDEVDSMLIDNGGHIAKLASPFPGMEYLRYIYVNIWQELHKAQEEFSREMQNKVESIKANSRDQSEMYSEYNKFMKYLGENERQLIRQKIIDKAPTNIPLVPKHLDKYVKCKLDIWLKNAVYAKYECKENEQYRIITNEEGEKCVAPIDYLNTGVTLRTTVWSNGLHQFIQLKHNLRLTFESLTSCFVSNLGYIKKYKASNIFGLTGTLGSTAEQKLLKNIYGVNYAKLPTYKQKNFQEIPGLVCDNEKWSKTVTLEILHKAVDEKRAVLLICETLKDALQIEGNLKELKHENIRVRMYASEEDTERKDTEGRARIGDIIVATNIAGRGTNFKTEKDLEKNGGLHVCIGFLPCNLRVEDQGFGRTSRQGNAGTAQLIIRRSQVLGLGIIDANVDFTTIKNERDLQESKRLENIKNVLVKELDFKDGIFGLFSELYSTVTKEESPENKIIFKDLKEFWAFWLENKNYTGENIATKSFKKEFEEFRTEADEIIKGQICHNPFYCMPLADIYINNENYKKARAVLQRAKFLASENSYLLTGVHMREFSTTINEAKFLKSKIAQLLITILSFGSCKPNAQAENEAIGHLQKAIRCIKKEIEYLEDNFTQKENQKTSPLETILVPCKDNLFVKHIFSRLYALNVYKATMDNLHKVAAGSGGDGVEFKYSALFNMDFLEKREEVKDNIFKPELDELNSIGMNLLYGIKKMDTVPDTVTAAAMAQIGAGLAIFAIAFIFAPSVAVLGSIASTLISEGIIDLVTYLLKSNENFNETEYLKGKLVSYGTALVTFGFSALKQCVTVMDAAAKFCQQVSSVLRKCPMFKTICNLAADAVDDLAKIFENFATVARFKKMSQAEQLTYLKNMEGLSDDAFKVVGGAAELNKLQNLQKLGKLDRGLRKTFAKAFVEETVNKTVTKVVNKVSALTTELVIKPLIEKATDMLRDKIVDIFKHPIINQMNNRETLKEKLRRNDQNEIDIALANVLLGEDNILKKIYKTYGPLLVTVTDNFWLDTTVLIGKISSRTNDVVAFAREFSIKLDERLTKSGNEKNDLGVVIDDIAKEAALKICSLIMNLVMNTIDDYNEFKDKYTKRWTPRTEAEIIEDCREKIKDSIPSVKDTVEFVVSKL